MNKSNEEKQKSLKNVIAVRKKEAVNRLELASNKIKECEEIVNFSDFNSGTDITHALFNIEATIRTVKSIRKLIRDCELANSKIKLLQSLSEEQ